MNTHVAVPAKNLQSSIDFYQALGFSIEQQYEKPDSKLRIVRMSQGKNYSLELMHHPDTESMSIDLKPELLHIGIAVNNLERTISKLQEIGCVLLKPIRIGMAVKRFAFVADPTGFPVELFESK